MESSKSCPRAAITSCAVSTASHTEQCKPSVSPVAVHVGSTLASITGVCPVFSRTVTLVSSQREHFTVFEPSAVQVAGTIVTFSSIVSSKSCPSTAITSCAVSTSPHTEQCEPSVSPVAVHVGSTFASIAGVCPVFSRTVTSVSSQREHFTVFEPSCVHVAGTIFTFSSIVSLKSCPSTAITSCAVSTSPHTEQCEPSVSPVAVHVGSTLTSVTGVCPVFSRTVTLVASQREHFTVFEPSVVQVAGSIVTFSSMVSSKSCSRAGIVSVFVSLQRPQMYVVCPSWVQVASTETVPASHSWAQPSTAKAANGTEVKTNSAVRNNEIILLLFLISILHSV